MISWGGKVEDSGIRRLNRRQQAEKPTMQANPCKICETDENLQAKYNSQTGEKWVHCDECGRVSTPVTGDEHPVEKWNAENPIEDKAKV